MSHIIAVAGKGGVGKTSVSTLIVQELAKMDKGVVLAVDADPNSNLGEKLGIVLPNSIGSIRNQMVESPESLPPSMSKHEYMALQMMQSITEDPRNMDLMVMGRPQGQGCYCFINNVFKDSMERLVPRYGFVVVDNEAGMEHLARKTIPQADLLLLVSDPTVVGVRTAMRLLDIIQEVGMEVQRTVLIINNVRGELPDALLAEAEGMEIQLFPHDPQVESGNMLGRPLQDEGDSPLRVAVSAFLESVLR